MSVDSTVKADAVVMEKPRVACGSEALTGVWFVDAYVSEQYGAGDENW